MDRFGKVNGFVVGGLFCGCAEGLCFCLVWFCFFPSLIKFVAFQKKAYEYVCVFSMQHAHTSILFLSFPHRADISNKHHTP